MPVQHHNDGDGPMTFANRPFFFRIPFVLLSCYPATQRGNAEDGIIRPRRVRWKKPFMGIINNAGGLAKLNRTRPSTGYFGNWGIIEAAKRVSARYQHVSSRDSHADPHFSGIAGGQLGHSSHMRKSLRLLFHLYRDCVLAFLRWWLTLLCTCCGRAA